MARLLIVDDDPYIIHSLKSSLTKRGHEVFAGHNGQEGVQLASKVMPDLLIIDLTMPVMDGLEATQQIRQRWDMPIIMLTAETDEEEVIAALEVGVDEYLNKPFRLNELAARVQALLRRHNWATVKVDEEVAQLRQALMSTMTHELRTPIVTILNTLEIALASSCPDNLDAQLNYLEQVQHNTQLLNRLVDDLLLLVQVNDGVEILRRPFPLKEETGRLIKIKQPELDRRALTVQTSIPPDLAINCDINKVRHALLHLLDNAIKFSHLGQEIRICVKKNTGDSITITIADEGIGIHPKHYQKIFDRFYQVDFGDNRKFGGLGVGLAIVQAIAEAHGGTVSVQSQPGAGSQFFLTLPVAEADWQL